MSKRLRIVIQCAHTPPYHARSTGGKKHGILLDANCTEIETFLYAAKKR